MVRNYTSMEKESFDRKGFMPSEAVAIKPAIRGALCWPSIAPDVLGDLCRVRPHLIEQVGHDL